ncbi:hypothetical protein ABWL39_15000 [Chitinivorax sp. PXF-14]
MLLVDGGTRYQVLGEVAVQRFGLPGDVVEVECQLAYAYPGEAR